MTSTVPSANQSPHSISTPSQLLFDFSNAALVGRWANIDDPVMGGRSRSTAGAEAGALVFSGTVSLENNGGFASIRGRTDAQVNDLSAFDAVRVRVRGDGKTYIFALESVSDPRLTYWQRFNTAPGEWIEATLPFGNFEPQWRGFTLRNAPALDARGILNFGFYIADKQSGPFRLEVAQITAVVARAENRPAVEP